MFCVVSIKFIVEKMASCCSRKYTSSFQEALTYALEMLGCPELALKEEQKLAIHAIYSGSDVFVWLPTGFGKSMCFHTLPFVFDYKLELVSASKRSVVVVVAPLVALMVDQVQSLRAKGVEAAIVSSGGREGRVAGDLLASEDTLDSASLLFCSPEALLQDRWLDALEKQGFSNRVRAVIVDEAHCVSKWYVHMQLFYALLDCKIRVGGLW